MRDDKENIIVKLTFEFSLDIMTFAEELEEKKKYVFANQILKAGTSIGANVSEAQNAESKADFIHKMKICLKELKESQIALQIIRRKPLISENAELEQCISECNELIAIFLKSIDTANQNSRNEKH